MPTQRCHDASPLKAAIRRVARGVGRTAGRAVARGRRRFYDHRMRFLSDITLGEVVAGSLRGGVAIAIAYSIWWIVRRVPWPRPLGIRFVLTHVVAWFVLASTWCAATNLLIAMSGVGKPSSLLRHLDEHLFLG